MNQRSAKEQRDLATYGRCPVCGSARRQFSDHTRGQDGIAVTTIQLVCLKGHTTTTAIIRAALELTPSETPANLHTTGKSPATEGHRPARPPYALTISTAAHEAASSYMDTNHDHYWVPTYSTGHYGGTDPSRKSKKRKNPLGFAPPKEAKRMTPYRERREAGYYDDKPSADNLTKEELQTRLAGLNQPTTGNKAELAQRLADAQKA